jgi:transposase
MERGEVILGVDTHLDVHVGALTNNTGEHPGTLSVDTDAAGYGLAKRTLQLSRYS